MELVNAKACPQTIKDLVLGQSDWFELAFLRVLMTSESLYRRLAGVLCFNPENLTFMEDFSNPTHNSFYRVLREYHDTLGDLVQHPKKDVFGMFASQMAREGRYVVEGEEGLLLNVFDRLETMQAEDLAPIVSQGALFWIMSRRRQLALDSLDGDTDPDTLRDTLASYTKPVKDHAEEDYGFRFGHGVENDLLDVVRIPTGLAKFDKRLGGGLGYTEYALGIACQGRGKTVMATQFLASMGLAGYKGILITTEQPHEQLEPRIISSQSRIPFDLIKDKVRKEALSPEQWRRYQELRDRLHPNVMIVDWNAKHSKTVVSDLEDEVQRRRDQLEGLDFVILDWLGGNLGAQGMTPEMKRSLMKDASDHMGQLALDHNIATLGWAQINMKQGANKKKLASEHISENKQLGEKAATIFSISSLVAGEEGNPDDLAFRKEQFLYISKARKSIGGLVPVSCEFDYQRIASR